MSLIPRTDQWYRKRVKNLLAMPQPQQRTEEWYKARHTRITASEAASCLYRSEKTCKPYVDAYKISNFKYKNDPLNPYETKEDYIIKKCSSFYGEYEYKDNQYTIWGKKYEDIATRLYKKLNNVTVYEFGLLAHNKLKWLAASPDGITENGVMLEIKCPKSRKIDPNVPPLYYWIQVQIQLECTNLDFCDFLECTIVEVPSETEFANITLQDKQDFGILLQDTSEYQKYIYPDLHLQSQQDYIDWKNQMIENNPQLQPLYYYITLYNTIRIERSQEWFNNVKKEIKETWELVMNLQASREHFDKYKESIFLIKKAKK